jgi:hypothetical protein
MMGVQTQQQMQQMQQQQKYYYPASSSSSLSLRRTGPAELPSAPVVLDAVAKSAEKDRRRKSSKFFDGCFLFLGVTLYVQFSGRPTHDVLC